ncbi:oxidoreductase [Chelatococcus asaccharovorans]|uniref:NADP-dependent 3-hydroxy acid dehydrogenase YdfG n=1 Tax=Chelatococcus asaccharovorans TaxID=28210 RepID=A0A2V3UGS5_9HYPH|nr:oxidoreductase [Chelatococcus asaccharovorans]MBS7707233.1 SDR family NAD(P)-dependent oxidoreductase [Chelatococcus asaccharovorans]PXW63415.1 NADP-dependent 3-hydroxy acid dehydrogenase YdfG [Chelatococcus asaccharovorans]
MSHDQPPPVWLITGCSTGFGRELATEVAQAGHRLCATARRPEDLDALADRYPGSILTTALDVTRQDQIEAAVAAATARFGRIDILVNNAGFGYVSTVEDGDERQIRAMFDTNVFGLFALCRAVIPGMRARRHGHIINITSIAGLNGNPGTGYYAATKHAVEGVSDALMHELTPFGIHVTCVEPGPFRTDFAGRSLKETPVSAPGYDSAQQRATSIRASSGHQAGDPAKAATIIRSIALSASPPRHLLLGRKALETAREKIARLASDIDRFESVTLSADYPPGS